MAMSKKEQALVEALLTEAALRRTSPVAPDVPVPTGSGLTKGFLFSGAHSSDPGVQKACSSSVHHAIGRDDQTRTQQPRSLYSTKLLALKALRYEVESHCAAILRRVDKQIEDEQGETK